MPLAMFNPCSPCCGRRERRDGNTNIIMYLDTTGSMHTHINNHKHLIVNFFNKLDYALPTSRYSFVVFGNRINCDPPPGYQIMVSKETAGQAAQAALNPRLYSGCVPPETGLFAIDETVLSLTDITGNNYVVYITDESDQENHLIPNIEIKFFQRRVVAFGMYKMYHRVGDSDPRDVLFSMENGEHTTNFDWVILNRWADIIISLG